MCGEDLAILRDDAEVIIIKNYKAAFQKKQSMANFAVKIRIRDSAYSVDSVRAVYMAFEHGRLAVVTVSGILIPSSWSAAEIPNRLPVFLSSLWMKLSMAQATHLHAMLSIQRCGLSRLRLYAAESALWRTEPS